MIQLKKDIQLTLLSRVPVMLLSFLSVIFLTRLLGPKGLGVYTFSITALNLFFTVIGFQLDSSLPVFLARDKAKTSVIFSAIGMMAIASFFLFSLVLTVAVFIIPGGTRWIIPPDQPILFFFLFLLITFGLRRISTLIMAALRGVFRFKAFNVYMILDKLFPSLIYGLLLFYTLMTDNPFALLNCFKIILVAETISLLIGLIILWRSKIISFSGGYTSYFRPIADLSYKSLASASGNFLNKRLDVWFVQFYHGITILGQYGLATQIANFVSDAMTPFNQVLVPYIAESEQDQHNEIVERTARLNMGIALVAAIGILSTSWLFIPLLFGKSFHLAVPATQILAFGIIFISQRLVFSGYFRAINQMQYPVRAAWMGVVITILLDILLIPSFGIIGASWATTIAYGLSCSYLIRMAQKQLGFTLGNILILRKSDIQWILTRGQKIKPE